MGFGIARCQVEDLYLTLPRVIEAFDIALDGGNLAKAGEELRRCRWNPAKRLDRIRTYSEVLGRVKTWDNLLGVDGSKIEARLRRGRVEEDCLAKVLHGGFVVGSLEGLNAAIHRFEKACVGSLLLHGHGAI